MQITIDDNSGFCFGVTNAIKAAEEELNRSGNLYCLGNIVHNRAEVARLKNMGMQIIDKEKFKSLKNVKVLIRAHGEPPETYEIARANNIKLIDATCKIVQKLQQRILKTYKEKGDVQIVIFGKPNHPEVIGLNGQINGQAIIINSADEINKIDFSKPVYLFSQTTMPLTEFNKLALIIRENLQKHFKSENLFIHDTICRQVSHRETHLAEFAKKYDRIIFVSSPESSNGHLLFETVKKNNQNSYFISQSSEIQKEWFNDVQSVGICGATSTPQWLMQEIAETIRKYDSHN